MFEDLQGYTRLELMKFCHKIEDIDSMNQLENIKSIAYHDMAAEYTVYSTDSGAFTLQ